MRFDARNRGRAGSSLVETMTAVMIIGVLSGIALPSVVGRNETVQREQALAELSADLSAARQLAMRRRVPVAVSFDVPNQELDVWADLDRDSVIDAGEQSAEPLAGDGLVTWTLPATTGTFSSKGQFSCSTGYWRVAARPPSLSDCYLYVFRSGQIHETKDYH
jgi:type II secretory pathway pseudopilin PulG